MQVALNRAWQLIGGLDTRLVDGAIVAALALPASLLATRHGPLAVVLILLLIVPLGWRRTQPLSMFLLQTAAMLAVAAWARPAAQTVIVFGSLLLGAYSMGACSRHRKTSFGVACLATIIQIGLIAVLHHAFDGFWFVQVPMFWLIGNSIREHDLRLEQEKEALTHAAAAAERARIARDMHDVVAHSVSVMVLQAEAARKQLRRNPDRAGDALQAVSAYGRDALTELRHMLGLLRDSDERPSLASQPSLTGVAPLVEQMRGTGFKVRLRIEGPCRPLPPGVDVTAFRVIQEALTNALKHAPGASAEVLIRHCEQDVLIQVEDDGGGEQPPAISAVGRGLRGMRERISIYGGQMQAERLPDGGFRLRVRLPNHPAA